MYRELPKRESRLPEPDHLSLKMVRVFVKDRVLVWQCVKGPEMLIRIANADKWRCHQASRQIRSPAQSKVIVKCVCLQLEILTWNRLESFPNFEFQTVWKAFASFRLYWNHFAHKVLEWLDRSYRMFADSPKINRSDETLSYHSQTNLSGRERSIVAFQATTR